MQEMSEEAERIEYIHRISAISNHYGDKLVELMERYGRSNLQEVTLREAKEYYKEQEEQRNEGNHDMAALGFAACL